MKKRQRWVSVIVLLALGLSMGVAQAQEKAYSAERFDVDITVEEGGSLLITETVVFDFVGGPFTFVFRDLPTDQTDGVQILSVSVDGVPYANGTNAGQVEIESGDPMRVTWHLETTSNATRSFVLTYRAYGVVRQEAAADVLLWQALPDEYEYAIGSTETAVHYPSSTALLAEPKVYAGEAQISQQSGTVRFQTASLQPNSPLVVGMSFTPGSLISAPPAWQTAEQARAAAREAQQAQMPYWLALAALVFVGGLGGLVAYWRQHSTSRVMSKQTIYNPPGDLRPGAAGAMTAESASPTWANALGTMFDLAARRVLRIDELAEKKWYREHDFVVQMVQRPSNLLSHEEGLLDLLFETKKGRVEQVRISELSGRVTSSQWDKYKKALQTELEEAGYFSAARKRVRRNLLVGGGLLLAFGMAGVLLAGILSSIIGMGPLAVVGSVFLLAVVALISGASFSPLSDEGMDTAVAWKAFAKHLTNVSKGKEAVGSPDMFEQFLPYA
ncbi:MAG: DUF2207 domain-containing protein, partial [Chloroflexi bacterium]|nr:DUF2207 domain-containing protein [Chloroflexota bacterium]